MHARAFGNDKDGRGLRQRSSLGDASAGAGAYARVPQDFLVTDSELEKLRCVQRPNPHNANWKDMKLYLYKQVYEYAIQKWGSEDKLNAAFVGRTEQKPKRRKTGAAFAKSVDGRHPRRARPLSRPALTDAKAGDDPSNARWQNSSEPTAPQWLSISWSRSTRTTTGRASWTKPTSSGSSAATAACG